MKVIRVGKQGRSSFTLPHEFVTETAAILARRGGGKTYTGNVVAEGLLECGHQVVVVDPLNAWWGLRSSSDGRKPGYPIVIFGGPRGDLPLDKAMGSGIADIVAENPSFSCVLSLRHLSKGAQKNFVKDFAERLFDRKGDEKLATAVHIFLDEADIFCPQQVLAKDAPMVGAIDDLVRRGRQAGIGVTMITQRSAALNKNVLSQAELLIAGQITGAHDKKAILSWIQDNADTDKQKEFMASLALLQIGQFWFWSPRWLQVLAQVDVRERTTFDSSATPKAGKKRSVPKKVSKVDLAEIKRTLQSAIETAEASDPKALRRRVAELERELKNRPVEKARTIVQGLSEAQVRDFVSETIGMRDTQWKSALQELFRKVEERLRVPELKKLGPLKVPTGKVMVDRIPLQSEPATIKQSEFSKIKLPSGDPDGDIKLPKCEKAILGVLAARGRVVTARLVALQSGYSIKSSGFKNALSSLRTKGLIEGGKDSLRMTGKGQGVHAATGGGFQMLSPEYWLSKLPKCERAIFEALLALRNHGTYNATKEKLAEIAGYSVTSSGFKNALSKLRGLQLIDPDYPVKLVDELFEE